MPICADPAVVAAKAKVRDASAAIAKFNQGFQQSVKSSPEYSKAKAKLDAARIQRDKAQIVLTNRQRQRGEAPQALSYNALGNRGPSPGCPRQ
jgi:hypothetical protein